MLKRRFPRLKDGTKDISLSINPVPLKGFLKNKEYRLKILNDLLSRIQQMKRK